MSLKTELRPGRPVRIFVDEWFPGLQALSKKCNYDLQTLPARDHPRYPSPYAYTVIGTAIDYRIRNFFTDAPHQTTTIQDGLRWIWGAPGDSFENKFWSDCESRVFCKRFNSWSKRFLTRASAVRRVLSKSDEDALCRYCVLLAWIDHARRSIHGLPFFYPAMRKGVFSPKELMGPIDEQWVGDMATLAQSFRARNVQLVTNFVTAATGCAFAGSPDVGGADCDMIVDGCLIEIKATIKDQVTTDDFRQIVGYCLLDYDDEFSIRSAAIHLVRQVIEFHFDLSELLPRGRSIEEVRSLFRRKIQKSNVTRRSPKSRH